jgi:hypothetical protein
MNAEQALGEGIFVGFVSCLILVLMFAIVKKPAKYACEKCGRVLGYGTRCIKHQELKK